MISTGPRHDPTWLAIAYSVYLSCFFRSPLIRLLRPPVRQVEHGRGTGRNQGSAKEQAAEEAYRTLIGQRGG